MRLAVHLLASGVILLGLLLGPSRYGWVGEIAPDLDPAAIGESGNRRLVLVMAIGLAAALEALALATSRSLRER